MFRVYLMFFQVCLIQSRTALNLNPQKRKRHIVMLNWTLKALSAPTREGERSEASRDTRGTIQVGDMVSLGSEGT